MPRTGRPRAFDRSEAVVQAMRLFWAQGYEATSLAQLKAAMGISAASFYAAFGSKEALFREVVQHYLETHGQVTAPLHDPALAPRAAVELALRQTARMQTDAGGPLGCLVVLSAINGAENSRAIRALLAEERRRTRAGLDGCVARAIAAGELPAETDAAGLGGMLATFMLGLSVQAKDGVPFGVLEGAIGAVMRSWAVG